MFAGDPQQLQQGGAILDQNGGGLQPDLSQLSEEERAHIEQVSRQSSFRAGEQTELIYSRWADRGS